MEVSFLLFFIFFVEAVILWQYTSHHFTERTGTKTRILLLCVLYAGLFALSLFRKIELNAIGFLIANFVFLYTQFRLKISLALFHTALLTAIMGVSELLLIGITSRYFPHFLSNSGIGFFIFAIFSKILYFTIIYFLRYLFGEKSDSSEQHNPSDLFLIIIPVSSIFVMFTFISIGEASAFTPQISVLVTVSAVFLLTTNLFVFGTSQYNGRKRRELSQLQLQLQKEADSLKYYEMLQQQNENQSILIHDIKKHLHSINLLNEKGEREKISAYIHQLMKTSALKESARICDNVMLNAILNRYQRQCGEKHIAFHADIRSNTLCQLLPSDMTALFCNLLDNAVESAENIPDSFIELTVQKKENSPFILINSCPNAPVYGQDGLPVSHKASKTGHGFGIKSIKKIVEQHRGNMQMYYDSPSGTFHTIITLSDTDYRKMQP